MQLVKKIRFALVLGFPMLFGAVSASCGDYSCPPERCGIGVQNGGVTPSNTTPDDDTGGAPNVPEGPLPSGEGVLPCDVFEAAGHPCVSAHSSVRRIVSSHTGSLYQLERSDGTVQDIGVVDGYADAAAHDAFCPDGNCTIKIVYDQSGQGNHLTIAPPGSIKPTPGNPVNASALPVTVKGRSVYGMLFRPGQGYRANCYDCPYPEGPAGTAVDDEPETIYMVTSQHDLINGCCFDYGNAETTANNDGNGTMEAVYFGQGVIWGTGSGSGPWVMADLENGLYPGWENGQDRNISTNTSLLHDFVTALIVGDTSDKNNGKGRFAIYGGDATTGSLQQMYDGIRPEKPGYVPMQKQGSIILGIGGDNSDGDGGRFYEGVMANGAATRATVEAVQATIVEAGYGN